MSVELFVFVFGRIVVPTIRIRPNSAEPLFGTALLQTLIVQNRVEFPIDLRHGTIRIRMTGLPVGPKNPTIGTAVLTQYRSVTDIHTYTG